MSVKIVYGVTADNGIGASSTTYATARAMTSPTIGTASDGALRSTPAPSAALGVGQRFATPNYSVGQLLIGFDLSAATGKISSAILSGKADDFSTTDFVIEARVKDWGAAVDTGDAVAGADLGSLPLVATRSTVGLTNGIFNAFTDVAMVENIVLGATLRLILASENQRLNVAPTQGEEVQFDSGDDSTDRIRLIISDSENSAHVIASGTGADTDATTFDVILNPEALYYAGLLLMTVIAGDTNQTIVQGGSMTAIHQSANGTACQLDVWARVVPESGSNANYTSENNDVAWVWFVVGGHAVVDVATDIIKGTAATGVDAAPEPPNCNPGVTKDWLWIECFAADDDDETTPFESANYTAIGQIQSASSSSSCLVAAAYRKLRASSEDPGAMAMGLSEDWVAQTFAIPPAHSMALPPHPLTPYLAR
jgi:hypothetical protein